MALVSTLVGCRLLNYLDVLRIRMRWVMLGLLPSLSCLHLHHILNWILVRIARHRLLQCWFSWLSLLRFSVIVWIKVLHLKVRLPIDSIYVTGGLLSHFLFILLIYKGVLEEFILILLRIGAFKWIKSSHEFDVTTLGMSVLNLHLVLPWTIVTVCVLVLMLLDVDIRRVIGWQQSALDVSEMLHRVWLGLSQTMRGGVALVRQLDFLSRIYDLRIQNLATVN